MRPTNSNPLAVSAIFVFLIAALVPEFFAERYGSASFGARIPGGQFVAALTGLTNMAAMLMAMLLFVQSLIIEPRFENAANKAGSASQVLAWWPYAFAWIFGAVFGAIPGVAGYSVISLIVVLAIASIKAVPSPVSPFEEVTRWSLRACVGLSLMLGVAFSDRAYAPYLSWPGGWREGVDRLQGLFPHPNTLGWVAALAVAFEILGPRRRDRMFFAAIALAALFLTGSRTASIALGIGVCVAIIAKSSARSPLVRGLTVGMGPMLGILLVAGLVLMGPSAESFNGREATWGAAWDSFMTNWVSGSGPGAYLSNEQDSVAYAHNQFLQSMSELGVIGLIALIAHVGFLARLISKHAMNPLGWSVFTMWIVMFVSENLLRFADPGFVPQIVFFQLCILVAMSNKSRMRLSELQPRMVK